MKLLLHFPNPKTSDLNDDENVDIHDLLTMISDWGPAPPNVIPPSDCSFAMILP